MPSQQLPQVNSESIYTEFQEHLADEYNERILFSAPFGAGKSTFLKSFFDKHTEYITLKLYPVNYSIAPNQDVFELIKYDLLYELLNNYPHEIELNKDQFSMLLISQMFVLHKMKIALPLKLLSKAASLISGTEATIEETASSIIENYKAFSDYKNDINENELNILEKYIKSFKSKKGHAYELDDISELIISMLDRIKHAKLKSDPEKSFKTVLLIDDLDRLDPEHIFRLFNLFSAHYDEVTETNKFGFDKIIFVCDVNNIQQMFNHRYGLNVEFGGYIDKFYSSEVFKFDIVKYLKESLRRLFLSKDQSLKFFSEDNSIDRSFVERFDLQRSDGFYSIIEYILYDMIEDNLIRIRSFRRFNYFALPNYKFQTKTGKTAHPVFYPILVLFSNMERFFSRPADLEKAFITLCQKYQSNYLPLQENSLERNQEEHTIIQYSLQFVIDEEKVFGSYGFVDRELCFQFKNEEGKDFYVIYKVLRNQGDHNYTRIDYIKCTLHDETVNGVNQEAPLIRPNPYWFLYNAYKNCRDKKYLN